MLRQAARLQPVPWRETLHELCRRSSGRESGWWLAGSTALAVRGAEIEPGDIDLVCSGEAALSLGRIFADALTSRSSVTAAARSATTGAALS